MKEDATQTIIKNLPFTSALLKVRLEAKRQKNLQKSPQRKEKMLHLLRHAKQEGLARFKGNISIRKVFNKCTDKWNDSYNKNHLDDIISICRTFEHRVENKTIGDYDDLINKTNKS